jgi:phosphopantothenoylcysteine synthetase/decarboxylase
MNVLVTAGNTLAPIDQVRCLTNIFTGRTGAAVALEAHRRGWRVCLLTSRPDVVLQLQPNPAILAERWTTERYQTFEDLHHLMAERVARGGFDVLIHSAAVSDYLAAGVYAPAPGVSFRPDDARWTAASGPPTLLDRSAAKVKSDEPELWLRLVRAPKLIDQVRSPWGFRGVLVKFKLEVGVSDERLLKIAERSRRQSDADLMAANTLEGSRHYAFLGPLDGEYRRVTRDELPRRLLDAVERLARERNHG